MSKRKTEAPASQKRFREDGWEGLEDWSPQSRKRLKRLCDQAPNFLLPLSDNLKEKPSELSTSLVSPLQFPVDPLVENHQKED
mmetsp:Transcript_30304/g.47023  ORF Transcript_30304/g.47023 Transcript_30304/m.47023 type:complete len:83 (-) Transcript_30304:51-299(-)